VPFPTTPVLDDFNTGATQNLTARSGWGATAMLGLTTYATDSVPTKATSSSTGGNFWGTSWADHEAWMGIVSYNPALETFSLCARITDTSTGTYYAVNMSNSATTDFQIVKVISGARTAIGVLNSQTVGAGDSVGMSVIGTQITSYYKASAGSWTQMDTVSDSSITGAGFIGWRAHQAVLQEIDQFGGGPPVVFGAPARDTHTAIPFTQGAGGGAIGGAGPH